MNFCHELFNLVCKESEICSIDLLTLNVLFKPSQLLSFFMKRHLLESIIDNLQLLSLSLNISECLAHLSQMVCYIYQVVKHSF